MVNPECVRVISVDYDDAAPWPLTPDGDGPSLELLDPSQDVNNGDV